LHANPNSFGAANNVTDTQINSDAIATALDNIANSATNDSTLMSNMLAQLAALTTCLDGMQQYHGVLTPPKNPSSGGIFKNRISRKNVHPHRSSSKPYNSSTIDLDYNTMGPKSVHPSTGTSHL
jgi:hypothetical protein